MAIVYTQFKTPQEMEAYLNSKVTSETMVNGKVKTITWWYSHREVATYVDRKLLRVYEHVISPEDDY